jgi:hypothetical protein
MTASQATYSAATTLPDQGDKLQVMSLGGWCRPAHQIHHFAAQHPHTITPLRGPFDWTITPFTALQACLVPGFVPQTTVLQPGRCHVSTLASGACSTTGVIFHHRLEPKVMRALGHDQLDMPIPSAPQFDAVAADARGRFAHTYRHLSQLKDHPGESLFVRWRRQGHPDEHLPSAFAGETEARVMRSLRRFLGHKRFHLLTIVTHVTPQHTDPFDDPVQSWRRRGRSLTCHLRERAGWNGDQTSNFKGDEASWDAALQQAVAHITGPSTGVQQGLARFFTGRYRSVIPSR